MSPARQRVLIKNGRLVLEERVLEGGMLVIEDGIIKDVGRTHETKAMTDTETIDAGNRLVGPGLIDIHTHLGIGNNSWKDPDRVLNWLLKHGVTGILPTIGYGFSREKRTKILETLSGLSTSLSRKMVHGMHMEGPCLNPGYGARSDKMRKPDKEEYIGYLEMAADKIKIWVIAPEVEGSEDLIEEISRRKIILSIGHSEAEAEKVINLIPKGLKLACHCMCATGPPSSSTRGRRKAGVDEAVMIRDEIFAEVIPDFKGIHVSPLMLQLLYKVKGPDRIIIITDFSTFSDLPTEDVDSDVNFNEWGQLSGSVMTMEKAVRNMMLHTGINPVEAFKMASLNPARLLKMDRALGSIKEGKKANLVIVSNNMEVERTLIEGETLFFAREVNYEVK